MKASSILETIGNTPHIRINRLFAGAEVWIKSERANPGGSIKDRIALSMIEPPGLARSDLIQTAASGNSRLRRICGVLPMVSRTLLAFMTIVPRDWRPNEFRMIRPSAAGRKPSRARARLPP